MTMAEAFGTQSMRSLKIMFPNGTILLDDMSFDSYISETQVQTYTKRLYRHSTMEFNQEAWGDLMFHMARGTTKFSKLFDSDLHSADNSPTKSVSGRQARHLPSSPRQETWSGRQNGSGSYDRPETERAHNRSSAHILIWQPEKTTRQKEDIGAKTFRNFSRIVAPCKNCRKKDHLTYDCPISACYDCRDAGENYKHLQSECTTRTWKENWVPMMTLSHYTKRGVYAVSPINNFIFIFLSILFLHISFISLYFRYKFTTWFSHTFTE